MTNTNSRYGTLGPKAERIVRAVTFAVLAWNSHKNSHAFGTPSGILNLTKILCFEHAAADDKMNDCPFVSSFSRKLLPLVKYSFGNALFSGVLWVTVPLGRSKWQLKRSRFSESTSVSDPIGSDQEVGGDRVALAVSCTPLLVDWGLVSMWPLCPGEDEL